MRLRCGGLRRPKDPGGPAEAERGPPRRLPDAQVHVCRAEASERAPGPCGRVSAHVERARDPREKQRQRCPRGSIGPGGTQQPRRIQPEDATPAQRYQAAQGGRAWEEPYTGQHLGWGRDLLHLCPQQRLHVTSFN
ncbi:mitotic-spindle organizing protein 2B isoform X2 [Homo sapiens]|uniref:mitotic-spindle organizing protein 2B isoform X2 n=1 Tax=Homo sapiens TaxID=9606 RepID=UPI000387B769|nr:mitotic-spindle organizing protein 2B isoform X2 [Homo sapiens]XP_054188862.1 mitotic-spindle organizing protein 2B isoform X2 [Homo sapiens]